MLTDELLDIRLLRVARAEIPRSETSGLWPCGFCGRGHPVHENWFVDYYHTPTRQSARAYVCPDCAARARRHLHGSEPGS